MNGRSSGQRLVLDADLLFAHRFEQRRLRARRGAVDLIGQHDVGEDRAGLEIELCWRCCCKIETPSTSPGRRSGVSWMRLNLQSMLLASALASTVLPTPGTSSISTCPREQTDQEQIDGPVWRKAFWCSMVTLVGRLF